MESRRDRGGSHSSKHATFLGGGRSALEAVLVHRVDDFLDIRAKVLCSRCGCATLPVSTSRNFASAREGLTGRQERSRQFLLCRMLRSHLLEVQSTIAVIPCRWKCCIVRDYQCTRTIWSAGSRYVLHTLTSAFPDYTDRSLFSGEIRNGEPDTYAMRRHMVLHR